MKKFKYLFIMVVAIMVSVSCSNDDDNDVDINSLVGTWKYSESGDGYEFSHTFVFNENLTGSFVTASEVLGEELEEEDAIFTWSTDGNKLTIKIDGVTEIATYSISDDKLALTTENDEIILTRQ